MAVPKEGGGHWIVKRVTSSARECSVGSRAGTASDSGAKAIELGETAAQNVIEANAIAENMCVPSFATVVLELLVRLERRLWGKMVGTKAQLWRDTCNTILSRRIGQRIKCSSDLHCIPDVILELQIAESNRMAEGSSVEVQSDGMGWSVVKIGEC